jgi:AcrR family transcriptional regulator
VIRVDQVTAAGRRYFLEHATIDMDELALALSVSRATLYRVINSRDRLLGEVLWQLAERTMTRARQTRTRDGIEGVLDVIRIFSDGLLDSKPFRNFLGNEPEAATRVLFTPAGGCTGAQWAGEELFVEAEPAEGTWIVGDHDNLAYLVVRIVESLYSPSCSPACRRTVGSPSAPARSSFSLHPAALAGSESRRAASYLSGPRCPYSTWTSPACLVWWLSQGASIVFGEVFRGYSRRLRCSGLPVRAGRGSPRPVRHSGALHRGV